MYIIFNYTIMSNISFSFLPFFLFFIILLGFFYFFFCFFHRLFRFFVCLTIFMDTGFTLYYFLVVNLAFQQDLFSFLFLFFHIFQLFLDLRDFLGSFFLLCNNLFECFLSFDMLNMGLNMFLFSDCMLFRNFFVLLVRFFYDVCHLFKTRFKFNSNLI